MRPEEVAGFLRSLAAQGFVGCNVTVPHKEAAFALADERDASARAVQAANTLWIEGGKLHAANTDTYGFMTYLDRTVPDWKAHDGPVCVLGAGGAARAIVYGFLEAGVDEVRVFNRTRTRAEQLAERVRAARQGVRLGQAQRRRARSVRARQHDIRRPEGRRLAGHRLRRLQSTTASSPTSSTCRWRPSCWRRRAAHGLRTVDGLGMLLHQAVPGFEKWFGVRPR